MNAIASSLFNMDAPVKKSEDSEETKRDKFIRLANKRLDNALDAIRLIHNLLEQPQVYQFNYRDVELIGGRLQEAVNKTFTYWKVRERDVSNNVESVN